MNAREAGVWGLIAFALLGGFLLSTRYSDLLKLRACDSAIKAELKAPATYNRVSPLFLEVLSGQSVDMIEYDAANSFGTPIRGKGYCVANEANDGATWLEAPGPRPD